MDVQRQYPRCSGEYSGWFTPYVVVSARAAAGAVVGGQIRVVEVAGGDEGVGGGA